MKSDSDKITDAMGLRSLSEIHKTINSDDIVMPDTDTSSEVVPYNESYPAIPEPDQEVLDDIDYAKGNIKELIEQGKDSLKDLIEIAKQTENARTFEVAANMMKTMLDANKQFIDTSKEKKYEKSDNISDHKTTNVTNNNLVISTAELLRMMKSE